MKSCHICQTNSAKLPHPQRELQPITPPERPWQHIGIDLFVDMPENSLGYKHVLVAVCYLSKYVIAHPIRTKTTAEVVAELLKIYLTYGVPKICQHDQGREFTSKVLVTRYCEVMDSYFRCNFTGVERYASTVGSR